MKLTQLNLLETIAHLAADHIEDTEQIAENERAMAENEKTITELKKVIAIQKNAIRQLKLEKGFFVSELKAYIDGMGSEEDSDDEICNICGLPKDGDDDEEDEPIAEEDEPIE